MKFSVIDPAAFCQASGEKPVFELRTSPESGDSDVHTLHEAQKNATRISTVIEVGDVSYLCEETPFVRPSAPLTR
jgi:hypothetical protein